METRAMKDNYQQLIDDIFSRHRSVQDAGFAGDAYKPGLKRMKEFDTLLGSPSRKGRFIHVAGTNGKGSVSHMTAAALAAAGRQVGLYTSPHLTDFRERMKIISPDGFRMISREDVTAFLGEWRHDIDRLGLSFFEITTGMALWWFAKENADISVIETGLGGRFDSTNIITPEISVITSIGLDHCAILGDSRAAIAREKAGIFKPGVPAVVGIRDNETAPVFETVAVENGCPLYWADGMECDIELAGRLDLHGEYQETNLCTAITALRLTGTDCRQENVRNAIAHCARLTGLHGRWECLSDKPMTITDIGHNPPALACNFAQLASMMDSGKYDRLIMVYGVMADKDIDSIIPMMPDDAEYIFTTPSTPRAMPAEEILERFLRIRYGAEYNERGDASSVSARRRAIASGDVRTAVALAQRLATPRSLIYIGGSAFVVADILREGL